MVAVEAFSFKIVKAKGILNAFCFFIAFIILIFNKFGILTIPGFIIALLAAYFSITNRFMYSAILGISTATLSFIAQFITVFCLGCTLSATGFALGGLLSLLFLDSEKIVLRLSLIIFLIIGIFFMGFNLPQYYQAPVIEITDISPTKQVNADKAQLYISPECKSCKAVLNTFIKADPEGRYWQPVIVPRILLAHGEAILKNEGYKGYIATAPQSPTGFVPLLQIKEQYYRGSEITPEKLERK